MRPENFHQIFHRGHHATEEQIIPHNFPRSCPPFLADCSFEVRVLRRYYLRRRHTAFFLKRAGIHVFKSPLGYQRPTGTFFVLPRQTLVEAFENEFRNPPPLSRRRLDKHFKPFLRTRPSSLPFFTPHPQKHIPFRYLTRVGLGR